MEGCDQSRTLEPDCLSPRLREGMALAFVWQTKSSHFWAPPGCQLFLVCWGCRRGMEVMAWGSHVTQCPAQSGDSGNTSWEETSQQVLSIHLLCACLRGSAGLLLGPHKGLGQRRGQ